MASLGGLLGKDNLSCLFQRVKVETNFPLKGPVLYVFKLLLRLLVPVTDFSVKKSEDKRIFEDKIWCFKTNLLHI